ncbi:hypothetical protein CDL15_Pgr015395 [Punica granatum]|uniref:non-specific serine/threonine protein kinase n=1 Tax=Punica granatum TaxID=22663 RepID=A0A218W0Y4_PUNGR|nr:hypothetical protein CDL15_Pgr015395 [Punica granatum]
MSEAQEWPRNISCACYTQSNSSLYKKNVENLLSTLKSKNVSIYDSGFDYAMAGQGTTEQVYGLFLCRGDLSSAECKACISTASEGILLSCPGYKESTIWYDLCMMTYKYDPIFYTMRDETYAWWYDYNISDATATSINKLLNVTLDALIPKAASGLAGKKFAVNKTNFTESYPLYTLAQCTPDLTDGECKVCLQKAVGWLPQGKQGAISVVSSCNIRYDNKLFYNETAVSLMESAPTAAGDINPGKRKLSTGVIVAIIIAAITVTVVLFLILRCFLRKRHGFKQYKNVAKDIKTAEAMQFDFASIQAATNNFSADNKLGEGGFGVVYKGRLQDGQDAAVKRLFRSSAQGTAEFKNEVEVVAKLQHRNLVRLLGFCMEGEEKILVFEYMPNGSLDYFLFDSEKRGLLDWSRRYSIISEIAQGMLYLHEYSRLRIIHRDLKISNILLDANMDPKISDFGMARIFGVIRPKELLAKLRRHCT